MASSDPPFSELKTYTGRCHCASTIFTVTIPSIETGATVINSCNCSICTKSGYLLVYPKRSNVHFVKGEDTMKSYLFGSKRKPHRFCGECGTSILIDFGNLPADKGGDKLAVSVRTFDGIEDILPNVKFTTCDGKHKLEPAYGGLEEKAEA